MHWSTSIQHAIRFTSVNSCGNSSTRKGHVRNVPDVFILPVLRASETV